MSDEHYGEVRIVTLEPLHVAAYRSVSETPEDDGVRYIEHWLDALGLTPEERSAVRVFGFDIDVSPADQQAGKRGYELWRTVLAHVQPSAGVEIKDFPGGLYAVMRILDPFSDPFRLIPGGWAELWQWVEKSHTYQLASGQGLEEVCEDASGTYMNVHMAVGTRRAVEIVRRDGLKVAGLRYEGKSEHGEIPAMWDVFLPRAKELTGETPGRAVFYGIARSLPGIPDDEKWEYLAGAEVAALDNLPPGMVGWEIPPLTYAVLPAHDVPEIDPVISFYYREWLPASDYEEDAPLMMELYPETFGQDRVMYLHFPVRPKVQA